MWRALSILLVSATMAWAQDVVPPELKAIEARYDQGQMAKDAALREKYITELTYLRWKLVKEGKDGWQAVDAEVIRHPGPAQGDSQWKKFIVGKWYSPRHDYLFKPDGTWTMLPADPDATQGTWAIHGNQLIEDVPGMNHAGLSSPPETIILINDHLFIATSGASVFYQKRSMSGGPPLRGDE